LAEIGDTGKRKPQLALDDRARHLLARFMSDWVWPRWRSLIGVLIATGLLAAATAVYPKILEYSFNALHGGDFTQLRWVLAAIVIATAVRSALLYVQTVSTNRVIMRVTTDMQKVAFRHLITADFARLTRETPGRMVSRLTNDIVFVQHAAQAALNTAVRDSLIIAGLAAYMIYTDWLMSLVVLCVYPVAVLPIATIGKRLRRVAKRTQTELGDMTSLLTEKLSGVRLIKAFRLEDYAASRMNTSFEQLYGLRMRAVTSRARLDPILEALGGIAVAGVVALAAWRMSDGQSSIGEFMGFIGALLFAAQPIRGIGSLSTKVQEGLAAVERIYEIIDEKPAIVDRPGARPLKAETGSILFDNVSFSYGADDSEALSGVTIDVAGGTTVALVGRSGAGKSTLINLVPRLFDVTGGRITIDGQDVRDVTLDSLRDAISVVSQDVTLFDDTIRANIALGRLDATEDEIIAAAHTAAAHDFIVAQPNGYDCLIGDRGMRLSGGQRQRLALARAILKNAPILLLDEATSALDTESEQLVQQALARFTKGRTTLVIAHRLSTVQSAHQICVMEGGQIIEIGAHAELVAKGGAYARLSRTQFLAGGARDAAH
jgi:subfamily B ATP-binding cassette protein MsbA